MGDKGEEGIGLRLGRYVLEEHIATGGMGHVYRATAYGAAGLHKTLCIKRIVANPAATDEVAARFIEEARLSMSLSHANLVTVFDFGRAADGYFLAMEWVDGVDIAALLPRGNAPPHPFPPAVVAYVGTELTHALRHIHQHGVGIIHRDIKPSNVLVSRDGEVKLVDFGVATSFGQAGGTAGTPGYMAPEQERGELVDERADLFGLGRVLLDMTIGRRVTDVAAALATVEPPMRSILESLLASSPDDRPATARGVGAELARIASMELAADRESARELLSIRARVVAEERQSAPPLTPPPTPSVDATFTLAPLTSATVPGRLLAGRDSDPLAAPLGASESTTEQPTPAGPELALRRRVGVGLALLAFALMVGAAGALWAPRRDAPIAKVGAQPRNGEALAGDPEHRTATAPSVEAALTDLEVAEDATAAVVAMSEEAPATRAPAPESAVPVRVVRRQRPVHSVASSAEEAPAAPAPVETGTLNVVARPWARVTIDGRDVGVTPILGLRVPEGTHTLRFDNDALDATRTLTIDVPPRGQRDVSVVLE